MARPDATRASGARPPAQATAPGGASPRLPSAGSGSFRRPRRRETRGRPWGTQAGSDVSPPRPRSTAGSAPPTSSLLPFPEVHVEALPFLSNTRTQSARAPSSRVGSLLSPTLPQPPRGPGASTHAEELAAPSRVSKRHPGSSFSGRRHRKAFERTPAPVPTRRMQQRMRLRISPCSPRRDVAPKPFSPAKLALCYLCVTT